MMRTVLVVLVVLLVGTALMLVAADLPALGDPMAPERNEVATRYIERAFEDTGAVNSVTAVVFDYRGYDTLGEATVLFCAAAAVAAAFAAAGSGERSHE